MTVGGMRLISYKHQMVSTGIGTFLSMVALLLFASLQPVAYGDGRSGGEMVSWNDFLGDIVDDDGDGQYDNFTSYEPGDHVTVADTLIEQQAVAGSTLSRARLRSYPNTPCMVKTDLLEGINNRSILWIQVDIVESAGPGGDVVESYVVSDVTLIKQGSGDVEDHDDDEESLLFIIVVLFGIFILPRMVVHMSQRAKWNSRRNFLFYRLGQSDPQLYCRICANLGLMPQGASRASPVISPGSGGVLEDDVNSQKKRNCPDKKEKPRSPTPSPDNDLKAMDITKLK